MNVTATVALLVFTASSDILVRLNTEKLWSEHVVRIYFPSLSSDYDWDFVIERWCSYYPTGLRDT
jgi:hypothetical protein